MYGKGWTMGYVKGFSDAELIVQYDRIHSNLRKAGIQVNQHLKRPASILEEPASKRLKPADIADTSKDAADPFPTDGGKVHPPSVLTQVDVSSVPSYVPHDTVDGGAPKPTKEYADAQYSHSTDADGGSISATVPPEPFVYVEEISKSQDTSTQESTPMVTS